MTIERLPLVRQVVTSGAEDPVFDGLLLAGPLVVLLLALLGRSPFTQALALGYVVAFGAHVLSNALR